jgi:hypothetical protein
MSPPFSGSRDKPNKKPARSLLATRFMLFSCLAYTSTVKIEEACSSDFQQTTLRYIPEERKLSDLWFCRSLVKVKLR